MSYRAALCPHLKIDADESCVRNNTQKQVLVKESLLFICFLHCHVSLRLQKSTVH